MLAAYLTAGAGLVLLLVLLLVVGGHVRRFGRAGDALRSRLTEGRAALRAAVPPRWSRAR